MGNSSTRCWHSRLSVVERYLVISFRKWGYFVAAHPLAVIIASLLATGIMVIGMLFIQNESDTLQLYVPENTVSYDNYVRYDKTWEVYQDKINQQNVQVTAHNNKDLASQENIFTVEYLSEFLRIHNLITDMEVKYKGDTYRFDDLCYRYTNGNCQIQSILQFYDFNQTLINEAFNAADNPIIFPSQFSYYSDDNVLMVLLLGQSISYDLNNHITATPALAAFYMMDYTLFGDELLTAWEDKYISLMQQESDSNSIFDITFQAEGSFNLELSRNLSSDIPSFVIAFVLIGVFASFILMRFTRNPTGKGLCSYKIDPLRNRSQLVIMGIISTICAIFGSFGVVGGFFGVKWNPVVAVSPFLLVGLGVDDMFVLLRAYELTNPNDSIADRIALTMERGGISILFTSITDLVAFCVGATSSFGSVSAFCLYCGVGVFFDFVFQVTFFLGMMVYDSRPDTCCICCVCGEKKNENKNENEQVTNTVEKNEKELQVVIVDIDIDVNDTNVLLSYMINIESASIIMKKLAHLILGSVLVKILILLLFVGYLVGASVGVTMLYASQDPADLLPNDSYLSKYFETYEVYFDQIGQQLKIVFDKHLDYSDDAVFNRINELVLDLRKDECFAAAPYLTSSWIHSYRQYLLNHYGNNTNSSLFYNVLYLEYLVSEEGESFIDDIWNTIVINNDAILISPSMFARDVIGSYSYQYINGSRIFMSLVPTGTSTNGIADCLDNFKSKLVSNYKDLGAYYYNYMAVIAESDLVTIQQTIRNLAYAMLAACFITIVLIPYPSMTIFVMTTVGQILFGVLGYMSLWGLPINTTTMINIVMSVGFSVDNAAHFCHAFMNAPIRNIPKSLTKQQERNARVIFALNSVGMPILAGDISTIVALTPLANSNSEIFTAFWKCISLVMMFGACYAVLYLPVVLSLIGPVGIDDVVTTNKDNLEMQQNINQTKPTEIKKADEHRQQENNDENVNQTQNEQDVEEK